MFLKYIWSQSGAEKQKIQEQEQQEQQQQSNSKDRVALHARGQKYQFGKAQITFN